MRSEGGLSALAKTHGKRFCNDVQSTKRSTNSHRIERFLVQLKRTSTILMCLFAFPGLKGFFYVQAIFCIRYGFLSKAQDISKSSNNCCWVVKYQTFIIPYYWCSVLPKNAGHYSVVKIRAQSRTSNCKAWFCYLASLVRRLWEM